MTAASPSTPSPSVSDSGRARDTVYVGAGNAAQPGQGGYEAYAPAGGAVGHARSSTPAATTTRPAAGVQASMAVADLQGATSVVAGSLDQERTR